MDDFLPYRNPLCEVCAPPAVAARTSNLIHTTISQMFPAMLPRPTSSKVQFKNTRKGYYHNDNHLDLVKGDQVAVESNPGHDIGVVTLTGQLVLAQLKKAGLKANNEIRRVYRKARPSDLENLKKPKPVSTKR